MIAPVEEEELPERDETAANPFVGPRAYGRDDRLYGRDGETEDLLDLLVAERVVLLHSPSGAGKTSLVQARLVPRLEEDGFHVHPIVRAAHDQPTSLPDGQAPPNRYALSTLLSFEEALPAQAQRPIDDLAGLTVARYLAEAPRPDGAPDSSVVVFDQLEEVLTTSSTDRRAKVEFFGQVGAALCDRNLWALFVIREDFLAELDPYARSIPTRFANRYRLDLLQAPAALEAVTLSARGSGVAFHPGAAEKLVDDLRRVRVQHLGGTTEERGLYVEPVQLQVVCRQLWDRLGRDVRSIEESDVESVGDVDQALASYYAGCVSTTGTATGTDEGLLRDWVDRELITAQGFRAQTLYGPHHDAGLDGAVLGALIDTHLLRSESRRGAIWYELAHDRLVEPIQADNQRWRAEHLPELDRRAALWDDQGRRDDLLIVGPALVEAELALRGTGRQPSSRVRDFLESSHRRHRDGVRMEQARRRTTRFLVAAVAACFLALVAMTWALFSFRSAEHVQSRANVAALLSRAGDVAQVNPDLSMALADRAAGLALDGVDEQDQDQIQALLDGNQVLLPLRADGTPPRAVDFSRDGQFMAAGAADGAVRVWDRGGRLLTAHSTNAGAWAVSFGPPAGPDGPVLAVAATDGVRVWQSVRASVPILLPSPTEVYAVDVSPDGRRVAYGTADGSVVVADPATQTVVVSMRRPGASANSAIFDLGWTPDGQQVAAIDNEGHLALWRPAAPTAPVRDILAHKTGGGWAVDISADGRMIATAGGKEAALWDAATGAELHRMPTVSGSAYDADLSADGTRLLVVDSNGYLMPFDTRSGAALNANPTFGSRRTAGRLDPLDADRALVASSDSSAAVMDVSASTAEFPSALDITPDGTVVTASGDNGTLRLWANDGSAAGTLDTGPTGITGAALSKDGRFVATLDSSGHAAIRPLRGGAGSYELPAEGVTAIAISQDGRFLATADGTHAITVTDTTGRQPARTFSGHDTTVTGLSFGPSPDAVASVDTNGTAIWWYGSDRQMVQFGEKGDSNSQYKVVWSPRGDVVAIAGKGTSTSTEVWDVRSGKRLLDLQDHTQPVWDIAFDPSGDRLASIADDRDLVIWDVTSGKRLERRTFSSSGVGVAFAPHDQRVYVAGGRSKPYVGYLDPTELVAVARAHVIHSISADECNRYVASIDSCPS